MSWLRLAHRWLGGLIGLLLAVLGLTGTLLLHKDAYLRATLPHAADVQVRDTATVVAALTRIFAETADRPRSVLLASERLGVHRLYYGPGEAGAYANQSGQVVERWTSIWQRPEVWILDLHHHLLSGDTGELIAGVAALIGLGFVITGVILWWPSRRLFRFTFWPRRMNRTSIVHHHRDLGVVVAPLLVLSLLTGATMNFDWLAGFLVSGLSTPTEMDAARAPPKAQGGSVAAQIDWPVLVHAARARYPDAELRLVALPAKPGGLITVRMRQQAEWLPNGRTMLWFDPANGRMVAHRNAQTLPLGLRVANVEFPLHAGKIGGLAYRLLMTASGLSLTMLGTLTVMSFWGNPLGRPKRVKR